MWGLDGLEIRGLQIGGGVETGLYIPFAMPRRGSMLEVVRVRFHAHRGGARSPRSGCKRSQ